MSDSPAPTRPRGDLVRLLSASMGVEKARACVDAAAVVLGLGGDSFTQDEALSVLERIATQPGIVGITALFAKSRVLLVWNS